jgi:hypothetical protein
MSGNLIIEQRQAEIAAHGAARPAPPRPPGPIPAPVPPPPPAPPPPG